jgi:hypothetical protein
MNVLDLSPAAQGQMIQQHGMFGKRGKGCRPDKFLGGGRHHHPDLGMPAAELAYQLTTFVCGNAAAHADHNLFSEEGRHAAHH